VPDDGFVAPTVQVQSAKHFAALAADNHLREAVGVAVLPLILGLIIRLRVLSLSEPVGG